MRWCHRKCLGAENNQEQTFRLSNAKTGISATVISLCNERFFRNRIVSLGIQKGTIIEILKNAYSNQDCMIIKVFGSRLVLNRKLAEKIWISEIKK